MDGPMVYRIKRTQNHLNKHKIVFVETGFSLNRVFLR